MAIDFTNYNGTLVATVTGAVAFGDVRTLGSIKGVAMTEGTDVPVNFLVDGIARGLPKITSNVFVPGSAVHFNGTGFVLASVSLRADGFAVAAAADGATTCDVKLIPAVPLAIS
jgi:predicted RecA/RadA family phage recombinase